MQPTTAIDFQRERMTVTPLSCSGIVAAYIAYITSRAWGRLTAYVSFVPRLTTTAPGAITANFIA